MCQHPKEWIKRWTGGRGTKKGGQGAGAIRDYSHWQGCTLIGWALRFFCHLTSLNQSIISLSPYHQSISLALHPPSAPLCSTAWLRLRQPIKRHTIMQDPHHQKLSLGSILGGSDAFASARSIWNVLYSCNCFSFHDKWIVQSQMDQIRWFSPPDVLKWELT